MIEDIDRIIWPKARKTASTWNNYIYLGFLEIGLTVKRLESEWDKPPGTKGVLPFDIIWKSGERQRIWYDYADFRRHYYKKITKGNDVYFKIALHKDDMHYDRIYPIGQTAASGPRFPRFLPKLRASRKKQEFIYDVIGIFRNTDHGLRIRAVEIARSQPWKSLVGIAHWRHRSPIPNEIWRRKVDYKEHLMLQCRSKICLDFPGVGGEWGWRWTEILGMGCFCLRPTPLHACPGEPQNCWGEVKRDLSDMKEKVNYYLANDEARNEIAKNGMKYYEDYLSSTAQAKYLLDIARERRND